MLFENLVIRDLRVFLSTYRGLGSALHYYRDEKGLEVDVIVEHAGRWAGIEIKLSDTKADDAARNLLALKRKVTSNALVSCTPGTVFFMLSFIQVASSSEGAAPMSPMSVT